MADTANTLITDALLDLGVIADGETPTSSQASGGLRKFNNLIDSLNIENVIVQGMTQNIFPLAANKSVYTLGGGGDFNIARPNTIMNASVRDTSLPVAQQYDQPISIFNDEEYASLPYKAWTSTYPFNGIWVDDGFPLRNVYVNPIPTSGQYNLVFWTQGILGNLTLDQVISVAPGYKRMLTANLVVEMAPSYGQQVPQAIQLVAASSKAQLRAYNMQFNTLQIDPRLTGGGWYAIQANRYQ